MTSREHLELIIRIFNLFSQKEINHHNQLPVCKMGYDLLISIIVQGLTIGKLVNVLETN